MQATPGGDQRRVVVGADLQHHGGVTRLPGQNARPLRLGALAVAAVAAGGDGRRPATPSRPGSPTARHAGAWT